jgi:hypothetical protein
MLNARVADPTGGFDLVCGGNTTSLSASIRTIPRPSFVSVSGRAQLFRRDGKPLLTIRPDQVQVIDRRTRDQWIITTARATLMRLDLMNQVLEGTCADSRIQRARSHYSPSREDLGNLAGMVAGALASVRSSEETNRPSPTNPRETIMEYIRAAGGPRGVAVEEILNMAGQWSVTQDAILAAIESLIVDDECYQPQKGFVKPL